MGVRSTPLRIGGFTVKVTRPEKVLFPDDGITKRDLIDYYRRIAPRMLPFIRSHPIAMQRYPDGIGEPGFYQQGAGRFVPDWVKRITVKKEGGTVTHILCDNAATLVHLANLACITPHIWLSRADRLDHPDRMVFDLDPSGAPFDEVRAAARRLKEILDGIGLPACVKTTGSRGLHIAVPLKRQDDYDAVRAFARRLAEILVGREPARWTIEARKDKRRGRVFIDVNRNAYGQTVAPAYAVRPRQGAPVSTPIRWEEVDHPGLKPDGWTIRTIFERLDVAGDPWSDFFRRAVALSRAQRQLESLHAA